MRESKPGTLQCIIETGLRLPSNCLQKSWLALCSKPTKLTGDPAKYTSSVQKMLELSDMDRQKLLHRLDP
jgi:hypothetical protein